MLLCLRVSACVYAYCKLCIFFFFFLLLQSTILTKKNLIFIWQFTVTFLLPQATHSLLLLVFFFFLLLWINLFYYYYFIQLTITAVAVLALFLCAHTQRHTCKGGMRRREKNEINVNGPLFYFITLVYSTASVKRQQLTVCLFPVMWESVGPTQPSFFPVKSETV